MRLTVSIGGPVQKALLVWAGRNFQGCNLGECFEPPNTAPFGDQDLVFENTNITGTIVGTELDSIGYRADVTSIVQAKGTGVQWFSIEDADLTNNLLRLNGAGLIVLYSSPPDTTVYRVTITDGLDFAFAGSSPQVPFPENGVTTSVNFTYDATSSSRTAELSLLVGDARADRSDSVKINGLQAFANLFDASDGPTWDTDTVSVNIAAGSTSTSVQVVSGASGATTNPDSLLWTLAALWLPIPGGLAGCTPGFWKNHTSAWAGTGYSPGQATSSVFSIPGGISSLGSKTLLQSLDGGGSPGGPGGEQDPAQSGGCAPERRTLGRELPAFDQ